MLRERALSAHTSTPTLTKEQFVIKALVDFDLVHEATIDELSVRFDALAGARRCDVYVGVDCFARNTPYAAGPACAPACAAARAAGLSLALFAPGWSIECGGAQCASEDADAAAAADRRFWEALGLKRLYRD